MDEGNEETESTPAPGKPRRGKATAAATAKSDEEDEKQIQSLSQQTLNVQQEMLSLLRRGSADVPGKVQTFLDYVGSRVKDWDQGIYKRFEYEVLNAMQRYEEENNQLM